MAEYSDAELIDGLRSNDFGVLDAIYVQNLPKVTNMIVQNKGSENDARDVFQDAVVVLFKRLKEPDFTINSSFSNYLYGICKFIWLRQLKKKHRTEVTLSNESALKGELSIENELFETEQRKFYRAHFLQLGEDCQKVLQLFFNGLSLREIAKKTGYTNDYAKRKKYKCKEQLAASIKSDKRFAEYL